MGSVKKTAGTAGRAFDGQKFMDRTVSDISKGWKSATGATAKRHHEEKKRSEEKETAKQQAKVTEATKTGRAEAIAKRKELEAKGRDIDKVKAETIARGDVRDVTTEQMKGAGIAQAPQAQFRAAPGPTVPALIAAC